MNKLLSGEVTEDLAGNRLDQVAANLFPRYSRARLQSLIKEGKLLVNGQESRTKDRLKLGDVIAVTICLLYTSPSPRDLSTSRMPSSA